MIYNRITTIEGSAALLLSPEILRALGISIGDEVDIALVDRMLIVRPLDEVERARRINEITQALLVRRKSAYEQLAKGSE